MKHAIAPQARRSKRLQTDLSEGGPSSVVENPPMPRQQTGHGGAQEIQRGQASVPSTAMPTPSAAVEQVVQIEVLSYTPGTIDRAPLTAVIGAYNQPSQLFYSIAVNFGSRER